VLVGDAAGADDGDAHGHFRVVAVRMLKSSIAIR
jgi:hypothetical protein